MRKLATVRRILEIRPIEKADAIEVAVVDGWSAVVKKGEFNVGDLVVYLEVDSWVPYALAPFLSKSKEPKVFNGVPGERLRTIKLRGQLSQGLILSIPTCIEVAGCTAAFQEGDDVTEWLNVQKWERPISPQLAGLVRGSFPSFIPKTDQERAQNLVKEIDAAVQSGLLFEETEKLEGSSMTVYLRSMEPDEEGKPQWDFGVCSRNIDLKYDPENTFWKVAEELQLEGLMLTFGMDIAIQGELVGPGIQDNIYGLSKHEFYVFDVYDIKAGKYLLPEDRRRIVAEMGLKHTPVLSESVVLDTVPNLLARADGNSMLADTLREGVVYKQVNGGMTLKAVSNAYLLNGGER